MKIKTSELTGAALDWAVAKCEGVLKDATQAINFFELCKQRSGVALTHGRTYTPSTDWSQGGPIIEREDIAVRPVFHAERTEGGSEVYRKEGWSAYRTPSAYWMTVPALHGPTPLIAALRCYVAFKLGDEVDVPEELA